MSNCQHLNQKVDYLISSIESLKKTFEKEVNTIQPSENLNLEGVIDFLHRNGFQISKSSIYKLTSKNAIPFSRFGNRLFFVQSEVIKWAEAKLSKHQSDELILLSKVATKKLTLKFN